MAISALAKKPVGATRRGPSCAICLALEELPEADSKGLVAMLSDRQRRYTEIAADIAADKDTPEWIRNIHHSTYARHASGRCSARTKLR